MNALTKHMIHGACSLILIFLLQGCISLGPDYVLPDADVETKWLTIADPQMRNTPPTDPKWWQAAFHDAMLDQLVEKALHQNLTLRSAGLRVLQSQQQLAIAVGAQYPQQQAVNGSASRQKSGGVTFNNYSLGFNLGWEADFWGRFRRQLESASAELDASVAGYDGALLSMVTQMAQNYILIRTYQKRIDVAQNNITLQAESYRIAKSKLDAGAVSELDVYQAESLLNNTKASVFSLESSLQQFKNSLAILLGTRPQNFEYLLDKNGVIPSAPATIALGMPQDLIRRRPDIRTAERRLAAQSAQIGYAVTELYPHFSIGGSIGLSTQDIGDLFDNASKTWSLFGLFEWNVLNYGRLKSNVRLQDALFQQLLVDYQNLILQAQGDAESAIVAYLKSQGELKSYILAAQASQRAVDVATIQYQEGAITFDNLISTLKANVQQQDILSLTQGNVATNLVQIYKLLGGGWEIRNNKDPVDLLPAAMKEEMRERTKAWDEILQ
jgi:NodT family efflux transporter outer membrane factor (OMF) lipoprotein